MNETRLERIEDKLDAISERLASIDRTLDKQHGQLEYHIKRTNLLEDEIKPIREHVIFIRGLIKFLGVLALLAGIYKALV